MAAHGNTSHARSGARDPKWGLYAATMQTSGGGPPQAYGDAFAIALLPTDWQLAPSNVLLLQQTRAQGRNEVLQARIEVVTIPDVPNAHGIHVRTWGCFPINISTRITAGESPDWVYRRRAAVPAGAAWRAARPAVQCGAAAAGGGAQRVGAAAGSVCVVGTHDGVPLRHAVLCNHVMHHMHVTMMSHIHANGCTQQQLLFV